MSDFEGDAAGLAERSKTQAVPSEGSRLPSRDSGWRGEGEGVLCVTMVKVKLHYSGFIRTETQGHACVSSCDTPRVFYDQAPGDR